MEPALDAVRQLIVDRLKEMGATMKAASLAIGRNHAYLQQFIERGSPAELSERNRLNLAAFLQIDERRLRQGAPFDLAGGRQSQSQSQSITPIPTASSGNDVESPGDQGGSLPVISDPDVSDLFVLLPRYKVSAAAGHGVVVDSEGVDEMLAFRRDWLHRIGANLSMSGLISADGSSMEPTIPDKALMLVDRSDRAATEGRIYVIRRGDELVVKRVQRIHDGIQFLSDNAAFPPEPVRGALVDDIDIIGRVRWVGRTV